MDSLTQIVLGASVAEYIGGKKLGNKAPLRGAILGTLPDLDVFIGPLLYTNDIQADFFHRGITHSLFFTLVAAPLLGYLLARYYTKKQSPGTPVSFQSQQYLWTRITLFALGTHWILDMLTGYGTQVLQPFSDASFGIDSIFIVDPLYTLPFLICLIIALCYKRTHPKRRKSIIRGLAISTCYLLRGLGAKRRAHTHFQNSLTTQNIQAESVYASPELFTSFLRRGRAEDENNRYLGRKSMFDSTSTITRKKLPKRHDLLVPYRDDPLAQQVLQRWHDRVIVRPLTTGSIAVYPVQFGTSFGWLPERKESFLFSYIFSQNDASISITQGDRRGDFPDKRVSLRRQRVRGE